MIEDLENFIIKDLIKHGHVMKAGTIIVDGRLWKYKIKGEEK